jgi:hypothetical protein
VGTDNHSLPPIPNQHLIGCPEFSNGIKCLFQGGGHPISASHFNFANSIVNSLAAALEVDGAIPAWQHSCHTLENFESPDSKQNCNSSDYCF